MKLLIDVGVVFKSRRNFVRGYGRRDIWLAHAAGFFSWFIDGCASGRFIVACTFELDDGSQFNYPVRFFVSYADAAAFYNAWQSQPLPSFPAGFFGEWFNAFARPFAFSKVAVPDWSAWLAAN